MTMKKIRKLLISTAATALLGTLTIGVANISASAAAYETYDASYHYFNATGGDYTLTNPTEAGQGVRLKATPTSANGTVDLSFNGAGRLYNYDTKTTYWGGEFHYKMENPDAVKAVVTTYRSAIDQNYSISFITTAEGTYVSLTDDFAFQNGVPYANGATVPMTMDWTEDCATLADMVIGFRPTKNPTKPTDYMQENTDTDGMFKGGSEIRDFNLLNATTMKAEAKAAGNYADRYTEEWIKQLCWDMSYSSVIMEISFIDVANVDDGAEIAIWTMNSFDYQAYISGGRNSGTNATQRQQFDYNTLFVQKTNVINFDSTAATGREMPDLWEVWTPTTATGRDEIVPTSETYISKSVRLYVYDDASMANSLKSQTIGNNLWDGGNYHLFRPGVTKAPIAYYKQDSTPWAGRFYTNVKAVITLDGGAEQTVYVPNNADFCLGDIEGVEGCPSATWTSGVTYAAGKSFGGKDTIKINNEFDSKLAVVTTAHTSMDRAAMEPTCSEDGVEGGTECSVCGKELTKSTLIPALGHSYGDATYEWSEDHSTCTATAVCTRDETHVATETRWTNYTVTQNSDCTNEELSTYTATFLDEIFGTATEEDVKTADADNKAHVYGEVTYTWSADNTKCTATRVCLKDETHVDKETVTAYKTVTQEATATQVEISTMTANFKDDAFEPQTKENVQTGDKLEDTASDNVASDESATSGDGSNGIGCFGSVRSLGGVALVLALAGAVVAIKRKKEN